MSNTDNAARNAAVEAIDAEIDAAKASLETAIQDHALRLSGLYARRQVAMLAESLVNGIDGFVGDVLAAQRVQAGGPAAVQAPAKPAAGAAKPRPPAKGAGAKANPPAPAPEAGRKAPKETGKPGAKSAKAEGDAPKEAQPKTAKVKGPSRRAKAAPQAEAPVPSTEPTQQPAKAVDLPGRVLEILQSATDPMTPGQIAAAIGIPSRGVGPYLVALTRRKRAVRAADGRYTAAEAPVTEAPVTEAA